MLFLRMSAYGLVACVALGTAGCSGAVAKLANDAGTPDAGGDDAGSAEDAGTGTSCTTSGDCSGRTCVFNIADGCSAKGTCITPPPGPQCNLVQLACSCTNQSVNIACTYPSGYASAPIAYTQECELSVPDSGADAAAVLTCGTTACTADQVCKVGMGGVYPGTTSYTCVALPSACVNDPTCDCVKPALGATMCSASPAGVTVTFEYP